MLGRVLKEVKLPFPDDFFPEMEVSAQLADDFHHTATRLLHQTLEAESPVTRFHPSQQPDDWKLIGDRNGLQLYRERGFAQGNAVKVNVLGQMTGTLEDVLLGLYATTNGALKTQRSIMHSDYLDAAVLHVLDEDPYSEDDTGFSYQFAGLKWLACVPTGKLVHKRDLCWHEELGRTQDANGEEVGYLVMQSVRVDECPPFEQQGLTRSTAAVCYIFRPLPNNRVAVYMKGQHAVGGKSRSWSADSIMVELWLGVASALECAKAKRLSKLVSGKEMFITSAQSKTCDICDSKLKMLKTNQNCKICGKNVCDRCRMTKMIYPSRNTGNFPCSYFFCKPCLSDAKEKLYGRSVTRISFHSEDSSGRSGSNRSGSPRYARAPAAGRPGLSMMSSSSDPTPGQRQRAPSHDQAGPATYRGRGPHLLSPRSSSTSYSSARATVSSDPSMSRNRGFSHGDGVQSMRVYQPPGGPSGRSAENRTVAGQPRLQRATSDSLRRNAASRAYNNSRMPAQHTMVLTNGGGYIGNQSIDSTYDVEGNETYRGPGYISDDSDMSEDSTDEEDTSYSSRRRQLTNLYDADEGGVIEISRSSVSGSDSSTEPEPVDVFEKDKLKYINSFRTNDAGPASSVGGTTASSNGSTEQENLMERLMQINMAAEATYLMAKYNSNMQANNSR
ncbi:hypothetical protein PC128_g15626 [Phytophthora cactorum]|nr:hypothetical protein PC120_g12405 [Phytophthora cactorum]KAG3059669.1 hypothetical protein PC121_g13855 [Phytophthora cactorum]KAG3180331.1 hypothetical protein PC128_g15626 [Phytophthora cactorum]KAG4052442.1 hypothetical protein PC123_g12387 [Phytophthora cactorum]